MDELSKLFAQMEAQETRLLGIAHCIVPKEEEQVPIVEEVPVFVPPLPEREAERAAEPEQPTSTIQPLQVPQLLLMSAELRENSSGDSQSNTVQDVSPAPETESKQKVVDDEIDTNALSTADTLPSVILPAITSAVTAPTIAETLDKDVEVIVTTQVPISNPDENNVDIVMNAPITESTFNVLSTMSTVVPATSPMPAIIQNETANQPQTYITNLENVTVLNENLPPLGSTSASSTNAQPMPNDVQSTSPTPPSPPSSIAEIILGEMESVSKNPEPENYVYETFSPISPVEVSPHQRNEHIVLAEEPPEIPNDAAVGA